MTIEQRESVVNASAGRFLIMVSILLIHLSPVIRLDVFSQIIVFGAVFAVAVVSGAWDVFHPSLLLFIMSLNSILFPVLTFRVPSAKFLLPLVLSTAIILLFFRSRISLSWAKKGSIDRTSVIMICVTGVVSTAALLLWAFRAESPVAAVRMVQGFSRYPKWAVFGLGVPLFAIVNAFAEEVIFRGILQGSLSRVFSQQRLVLVLQAAAFAAFHFIGGFPNGYAGYLMTFVYGIALGYLRERSGGLLAPYLTHIIADLAIGYFLCIYVL
jgi:hypothetical protein